MPNLGDIMSELSENVELTTTIKTVLVGERIDTKKIKSDYKEVYSLPKCYVTGDNSYIVLFRYGAVVSINNSDEMLNGFIDDIAENIYNKYDEYIYSEPALVKIGDDYVDGINSQGDIVLKDISAEKVILCATILSHDALIDAFDNKFNVIFEKVEPIAEKLYRKGRTGISDRKLHSYAGAVLIAITKSVASAQIAERPDILWDNPDLERLYNRLKDEYELIDRNKALNKKFNVASKAIQTFIDLSQAKNNDLLCWYVIILLVIIIFIESGLFH